MTKLLWTMIVLAGLGVGLLRATETTPSAAEEKAQELATAQEELLKRVYLLEQNVKQLTEQVSEATSTTRQFESRLNRLESRR